MILNCEIIIVTVRNNYYHKIYNKNFFKFTYIFNIYWPIYTTRNCFMFLIKFKGQFEI